MSEFEWIKITTGLFDDEKIKVIESMPEGDTLLIIWLKLLILAGQKNFSGQIYLTEGIPYTEEMLSTVLKRPLTTVRLALNTFQQFKMIETSQNGLFVTNWAKYQNLEGMEKVREQTRKRVEKFRGKQKQLMMPINSNVTRNDTLTLSNAIDKNKNRIEEDIDKNINTINDNQGYQFNSVVLLKKYLNDAPNKVGYLGKLFLELHQTCTNDDRTNCFGRIGKIVSEFNHDYERILTAIFKSQDGLANIEGSHLSYIEGILRKNNINNGQETVDKYWKSNKERVNNGE